MRNFRNFNVWKEGIGIVKEVYELSELLPDTERYGLKSQVCRSAISIPSNIAEGCSRNSEIDFKRFLEISLGSSFELETQFLIIQGLDLISKDRLNKIFDLLEKEQKMLNSFIEKLKANG
jgi:four helix bundle protein